MSRTVEIRVAEGAEDMGRVRGLMRQYGEHLTQSPVGPGHICVEGFEAELAALPGAYVAPGTLMIGLVDDETAGCVALKPLGKWSLTGGALELKRLWVRPEFRGVRLGRRLVEAAIGHARTVGAETIFLDTVPSAMPEANRLYEAMGFRQRERYSDAKPVAADVVFFELRLGGESFGEPWVVRESGSITN